MTKAFYITAAELAQKGKDNIPDELLSAKPCAPGELNANVAGEL